jgi:hypothetical protein
VAAEEVGHLLHGVAVIAHRADRAGVAIGAGGEAGEDLGERGPRGEALGARDLGAPRDGVAVLGQASGQLRVGGRGLRPEVIERDGGLVEARLHESRVGRDGAGEAGASR